MAAFLKVLVKEKPVNIAIVRVQAPREETAAVCAAEAGEEEDAEGSPIGSTTAGPITRLKTSRRLLP